MRVIIVGAGVSGLAGARVLGALGLDVTVFEQRPDLGGVWSASRRYPGLSTQSTKQSYSFSDLAMPEDYPECPSAVQVHAYLLDYARTHHLDEVMELDTRVLNASRLPDGRGWCVDVLGPGGPRHEHADWLIMANGLFSAPHVPDLEGRADFEAVGGVVRHTSEVGVGSLAHERDLVVLGYGKSATDLAVELSAEARTTTMLVRHVGWKLPRTVGRLTYERMLLSRLGEAVVWAPRRRNPATRALARALSPLRRLLVRRLGAAISEQQELRRLDLLPSYPASVFNQLETPGFFALVDSGRIDLRRRVGVASLGAREGRPVAVLSDGTVIACDVLVAGTGFDQDVGVLDDAARAAVLDDDGDLRLDLNTVPLGVDRLAFLGWDDSSRSPLGAEIQSMWLAALMHGLVEPSSGSERGRTAVFRLRHADAEARQLPQFEGLLQSIPQLDTFLAEAGLRVPARTRLRELLGPVDPASYAGLLEQLRQRTAAAATAGSAHPPTPEPDLGCARSS